MNAPSKPLIRFFVSYAHQEDRKQAEFLHLLRDRLKNSRDYQFDLWTDHKLDAGVGWRKGIQEALEECDFGLLLVSSAFFASEFITREELPGFVEGTKPCIPVCLTKVDLGNIDTKGLQDLQIFFLRGVGKPSKAFSECTGNTKADFVNELAVQIEKRVTGYLASAHVPVVPVTKSSTGTSTAGAGRHQSDPELAGKLEGVFGSQFSKVREILENNRELRKLLVSAFHVPTGLDGNETTLRLMVHFHSSFIEALGKFDQLYRQGDHRESIAEFAALIMFLAMCPDYAERMKHGESPGMIEIPKDARHGIVSLLTCWVQGEPRFPLGQAAPEKSFGAWEAIPKDRLKERQAALMKQYGIDAGSADAGRLLKSKLYALKNAGEAAWLVIADEDRDLLPELLREGSPFEHMLVMVKSAEATIHARRGSNYDLNFEDQLEHLVSTLNSAS